MKYKNYIALILLLVFIGKLISVDAKFMKFTSQNNFLSSVNPNCKRFDFNKAPATSKDASSKSDENHIIKYICSTPYNLEQNTWDEVKVVAYLPEINYLNKTYPSGYLKRLYPPPKA